MKNNFFFTALFIFIYVLIVVSCSNNQEEIYESPELSNPKAEYAPQQFAKRLAYSLKDNTLRSFIQKEASLQKDGDYDILLADVINKEIEINLLKSSSDINPTFRDYLKVAKLRSNNLNSEDEDINYQIDILLSNIEDNYPLLQIAVPNFEGADWEGVLTGDEPFMVAFLPEDYNDGDDILAYDQDGIEYILDGKEAPSFPVIVISRNERLICADNSVQGEYSNLNLYLETNNYSYFQRNFIDVTSNDENNEVNLRANPTHRGTPTAAPQYYDYIWKAKFRDNDALEYYEGWPNGRPEVCCTVVFSTGLPTKTIEFNDKGWWDGAVFDCNTQIIKWNFTSLGYYVAYRWYESDGGQTSSTTITMPPTSIYGVTIPGASVTIPSYDADDVIGVTYVDYDSANGQSYDPTGSGKFTWWNAYR
jgi:hypothetical protein